MGLLNDKLMDYCVLDIETDALGWTPEESEIVEICIAKYINGKQVGTFHEYIKPSKPLTEKATMIHGITNEMVENARSNDEVVQDARKFIGDMICIAHNGIKFDFPFLEYHSKGSFDNVPKLDTFLLAKALFAYGANGYTQAKHRQMDLGAHYKIKNEQRHSAWGDVDELKRIFVEMQKDADPELINKMIRRGPAKRR